MTVEWHGYVSDGPRYYNLLRQGDLFVYPTQADAVPKVVIEALAAGLPVVANDIGAIRHLVGDGARGRVVPADDPAQLADAVADLLRDPEERRRMHIDAISWAGLHTETRRHTDLSVGCAISFQISRGARLHESGRHPPVVVGGVARVGLRPVSGAGLGLRQAPPGQAQPAGPLPALVTVGIAVYEGADEIGDRCGRCPGQATSLSSRSSSPPTDQTTPRRSSSPGRPRRIHGSVLSSCRASGSPRHKLRSSKRAERNRRAHRP